MTELDSVRANQETPASHIANALMVLRAIHTFEQSPKHVEDLLTDAENRLTAALQLLRGAKP